MSWLIILALSAGVAAQRLSGMFLAGPLLAQRSRLAVLADLLPAAVVAGVIVQLTFTIGDRVVIDERAAGLAVAGFLVWRRAPLALVVAAAALVTAGLRFIT